MKKITIWYHDGDFDKDELKYVARQSGHSVSQQVVQLIKAFLKRQRNKEKKYVK